MSSLALRRVLALAALALASGSVVPTGCGAPGERIVLISIDTLRYDGLAGLPGSPPPMRHTRAYAERGHVFEAFFAASPATQPTHATLFTGLQPWQHGVTRNGQVLADERRTLAERLREAGFETAAVVASFPLERRFGFAQGFDRYEEVFEIAIPGREWQGALVEDGAFYSLAESVTARAISQLDSARGARQFFWFHYFDPHSPYGDREKRPLTVPALLEIVKQRPDEARRWLARARKLYEADLAGLDRSLAQLFQRLDAEQGRFATHVLFTSDHGESFGEDGSLGHGQRLTAGQVHVPCFLVSPQLAPARRRDVAGSVDVAPTLLALAGLDPGASPGRDLAAPPTESGGAAFGMRRGYDPPQLEQQVAGPALVLERPRFFAVRDGALWAGDAFEVQAGDLAPGAPPPEELGRELRERFAGFEAELAEAGAAEDLTPETRRALEALGYTR